MCWDSVYRSNIVVILRKYYFCLFITKSVCNSAQLTQCVSKICAATCLTLCLLVDFGEYFQTLWLHFLFFQEDGVHWRYFQNLDKTLKCGEAKNIIFQSVRNEQKMFFFPFHKKVSASRWLSEMRQKSRNANHVWRLVQDTCWQTFLKPTTELTHLHFWDAETSKCEPVFLPSYCI